MKKFFDRLNTVLGILQLLLALVVGMAGAWLLGGFLGMGLPGYCLGLVIGVAIVFGAICFDFS